MYVIVFIVLCLSYPVFINSQAIPTAAYWSQKFNVLKNAEEAPNRMFELMRTYYEEAHVRITELNDMRFMFEESPHYEMGYVTNEIIDKYRKVVTLSQRSNIFNETNLFDSIKLLEIVQKLSFEIYHLVAMVHEIPRKYSHIDEFRNIEKLAGPEGVRERYSATAAKRGNTTVTKKKKEEEDDGIVKGPPSGLIRKNPYEIREMEAKKHQKQLKKYNKIRNEFLTGMKGPLQKWPKKPYNRHWPLNYGWEIDYNW